MSQDDKTVLLAMGVAAGVVALWFLWLKYPALYYPTCEQVASLP